MQVGIQPYPYNEIEDSLNYSLKFIDESHAEIHDGNHYSININKDMSIGGTYNLSFTTPNNANWMHTIFGVSVELEAEVILYEDVTSFTGGTSTIIINHNRNSSNVSNVLDLKFDTTVTLGSPIIIATGFIGSGRNFGGDIRNDGEFILKQNTKYYLLINNKAVGASNECNINMCWYEHANR